MLREGVAGSRIHFVGNVMIDTLRHNLERAVPHAETLKRHAGQARWEQGGFAVLTLHRPSNVDDPYTLRAILSAIREVGGRLPVAFAIHPRTRARIEQYGLEGLLEPPSIFRLPPIGYLEMLGLMRAARLVLTDSGGIQEETTALGIPCVTLRDTTERPITVSQGTNRLAKIEKLAEMAEAALDSPRTAAKKPELWDGKTASRVAASLCRAVQGKGRS